jgi:hypothetical protein
MAGTMISRSSTAIFRVILLTLLCGLFWAAYHWWLGPLPRGAWITGWLLFALMLLLTLYNGRKKIPFLPLGNSKTWLAFHVYAGWFTALLFLLHVHGRWPSGPFEISLTAVYSAVMLSGIGGLLMSRSFPRRLTTRGGEVLFERIPVARRELREKVEALALGSISDAQATVADFYLAELRDFFAKPKFFWLHLFEVRAPLNDALKKISDLDRFLNEKERATTGQIAELVRRKDGLDYHYSLQLALKIWLFVHIPLTYSLLILSILHIIIVYGFGGGAP